MTLHQAIDVNVPIACGDAPVFPGDMVVGDSDGVIVIPNHLVDDIIEEGLKMEEFEQFVTEQVEQGKSIVGLYPLTDEQMIKEFNEWKSKK